MDAHAGRQRPFPAVAIVSVLVFLSIFPGQHLITKLLPGISGLARVDPSLTILDIPVRMPVTMDMILAPGLFIFMYVVVILLYPSRSGMFSWREVMFRMGAVFAGVFTLLLCMGFGALISYLVQGYLPKSIKSGVSSLAINADIHLPYAGYEVIRLRGNIIILICFIIGAAIFIQRIKRAPRIRKVTRLTREQRRTPYERILLEKREQEKRASRNAPGMCCNHPLLTIRPEAVNYRPLE